MIDARADYDSPWKEAIELYFREFMAFFFPAIAPYIDEQRDPEFLDTELQQIVRDADVGRRWADKLVKVWLVDGTETWLLIHIEVQSQYQVEFAQRMYVYNYRLRVGFSLYAVRIVTIVQLSAWVFWLTIAPVGDQIIMKPVS